MTETFPPFSVDVPEGFHELPITSEGDARVRAVAGLVETVYPQAGPELWQQVAPMFEGATTMMADAELSFAAIGLFGDGPDKVAQCALTLAVAPSNHPTAEIAAHGIREILARTDSTEADYVELPCGPAVTGISITEVTYDGEYTATGEPVTVRMGRLQAFVPFPTGPYLAVLTLDTPAMDYWENFSVMMGTLLMGIEFHEVADADEQMEPSL
ncbi:hypothetical protein [Actinacidiphila rubida]|uniref:Uncharacterized protein n=1 Tax=Actinacidiphila rubida TaxID=310780 RepID=A0A1H8GQ11_9ACTN|nr:hypothetical protein [Actinacidiphila rubida]SEN45368.1 hypothetical protein SAMN05216267_1005187 [Actinacidiphila rubida]